MGNADAGVLINGQASNNTIGGITPGDRNLISANDAAGVQMKGNGTTNNNVQGNFIGTDVTGSLDLGNATALHEALHTFQAAYAN